MFSDRQCSGPYELKTTTTSKWHTWRLSKQLEMFSLPLNLSFFVSLLGAMQNSNRKPPTHDSARERFRTLKAS